jgi:hypothetical protein
MSARNEGYDKGYHTMNAHELVMTISDTSCLWTTKELAALEFALRRKVIEEASVKRLEVMGEDASTGWLKVEAGTLPSGLYDLIPKET